MCIFSLRTRNENVKINEKTKKEKWKEKNFTFFGNIKAVEER